MKSRSWAAIFLAGAALLAGCGDSSGESSPSSSSSTTSSGAGGAGGGHGAGGEHGTGGTGAACSEEIEKALGPIDAVSTGEVKILSTMGGATTLFVDASAGGTMAQAMNPWIYVNLKTMAKVDVTDATAYTSNDWDLAIKRPLLRTNSGDGGPADGGAAFLEGKTFAEVTEADAKAASIQTEDWFDDACALAMDMAGSIKTTFAGWYDYNNMTLTPHPGVFVVRGADGALYKLAILDYYATPEGTSGMAGGRYKIEVAPLP